MHGRYPHRRVGVHEAACTCSLQAPLFFYYLTVSSGNFTLLTQSAESFLRLGLDLLAMVQLSSICFGTAGPPCGTWQHTQLP